MAGSGQLVDKNRFKVLDEFDEDLDGGDRDEEVFVGGVDGTKQSEWCHPSPTRTRMRSITFHVARVYRPLTSAAKIVQAGNRISLGPDTADNYIENVRTGHLIHSTCSSRTELMGRSLWTLERVRTYGLSTFSRMLARERLRMTTANGAVIPSMGSTVIKFMGLEPGFTRQA